MSGVSFHLFDHEPEFRVAPGVKALGRYEFIDLLGMGGTANVWRGQVIGADHQVAIKVQNSLQNVGAQRIERLEREFQLLNLVCSPYVVAVSDYGILPDGRAAVVFEHMRGSTLRELMEERDTFDLCDALDLTSQLLRALLDVHSQGIVHRDIKPDNIMILSTPHGRKHLKLFDFGIAKVLSGKTVNPHEPEIAELLIPLTSAEMTVGTPEYMAPEQISATNVGFHTDIYATGIVMYEMLFGEVPYTGRNFFEIAHKHLAGVLPPLPADLPDVIHQLIWRSLACRTEERFSSADEMLRAVEAAMSETRNTKWNSVSELEADGLSSFISSDVASTWTHVEDSCVELVSGASEADSSAPKEGDWSLEVCEESIDPKQWFDDFSLSNQIQALQAFEVEAGPDREAADQPPPAPPGGMILSSEAMRALTAQLQNPTEEGEVPAAYGLSNERRRKERPPSIVMPKSGGKPPWEVHIDEGEADCAATKDLSLTDMLAVLSDQQVRRPRSKPETATSLFVREHSKKHTRRWHTASGTK